MTATTPTIRPHCPLCASSETAHFDAHPKVDQVLYRCKACGFYFAHPHVPYVHSEHEEVEGDAAPGYWTNEAAITHYLDWREKENERLAQWTLAAIRPGRVLEIGVGDGPLTKRLAPQVADYWGIEPDTNALERARALLLDGTRKILPLRSDQIETAPEFANLRDSFDAVFLFSVLEHIPAPTQFFATARAMLKPDGRLIISVPNSNSFSLFYRLRKIMGVEPWTYFHISFFTFNNLKTALERAGFSVVEQRQHSLLNADSIGYFCKRYKSSLLGMAMSTFAGLRLDRLVGMTTYFLVCQPSSAHASSERSGETDQVVRDTTLGLAD